MSYTHSYLWSGDKVCKKKEKKRWGLGSRGPSVDMHLSFSSSQPIKLSFGSKPIKCFPPTNGGKADLLIEF